MDEYAAFAAIYDDWASHMTEDVPFYLELVGRGGSRDRAARVGLMRLPVDVAQARSSLIRGPTIGSPGSETED